MQIFSFGKCLVLLTLLAPSVLFAESSPRTDSLWKVCQSRHVPVKERRYDIVDVRTPRTEIGKALFRVERHPGLDSLMIRNPGKAREILTEINRRCDELGKDSLLTSELFYVMRPYFDYLHYEDPHYRIYMQIFADPKVYRKQSQIRKLSRQLTMPAISMLSINDTLIVDRSLDPLFQRGDRVCAINGVTAEEYLKYGYDDRHVRPVSIMSYYHYSQVVERFRFELERNGRRFEVETAGAPGLTTLTRLSQAEEINRNIRTYPEAGCGYVAISEFYPVNSWLIKNLRKAISDFKSQGITNVILDLRRNPGGNGDAFDKLLSIFINKPVVEYCSGQRLKVSKATLKDYDFLVEAMLGQNIRLPDSLIVRSFKTQPKLFIEGMNYYVLVGRDTGSIAASFVNMLQYHHAAKLVGEPLRHNALKYGEVIEGELLLPSILSESASSVVEIDECTRRNDGYVIPDIAIPAIAAEYMSGRDAVLDKLIERIKSGI